MGCVVGMTSREGKERSPLLTPKALAKRLVSISEKNPVGLVFGPEREGLTNEELSLCHLCVNNPFLGIISFPQSCSGGDGPLL